MRVFLFVKNTKEQKNFHGTDLNEHVRQFLRDIDGGGEVIVIGDLAKENARKFWEKYLSNMNPHWTDLDSAYTIKILFTCLWLFDCLKKWNQTLRNTFVSVMFVGIQIRIHSNSTHRNCWCPPLFSCIYHRHQSLSPRKSNRIRNSIYR